DSGTVNVSGKKLKAGDVQSAIRAGIGHIPEDRKGQALVLDGTVNENLGYATLAATAKAGLADRSGQKRRAQDVAEKLRIRMANIDQPIRNLSGGNQQKAVFGRWVLANSRFCCWMNPPAAWTWAPRWKFITSSMKSPPTVVRCSWSLPICRKS